jgi:aspartokinase
MFVADEVKEYVEKRPYVQEALAEEIVNYSALARKAQEEIQGSFEAVKMALRRDSEELAERRRKRSQNVGKILEGSSIELQSNIQVCECKEELEGIYTAETDHGYTVIQESGSECNGEVIEDQVVITIKSSENLKDTPGVIAYITSILAGQEINITELISCREDTHIIIDEKDATEAFKLLNERLK